MTPNPQKHPRMQALTNLEQIESFYDVFIFDLWGVVHNGKQAFSGAIKALQTIKSKGKPIYFLSNAPRRVDAAKAQLVDRGVPLDLYVDLYTSGEETHEFLRDRSDTFYQNLGKKLFHMGPEKDKNLFHGLDYEEVPLDQANFILNTGTLTFEDTLADYVHDLKSARHLDLPMVCANPDMMVLYGEGEAICSGLMAKEYENMGGIVRYHGKPYAETYTRFFKRFNLTEKKILMLGDSLRTDIKGCNNAKIDSVWITSGIHKDPAPTSYDLMFQEYGARPTFIMQWVNW